MYQEAIGDLARANARFTVAYHAPSPDEKGDRIEELKRELKVTLSQKSGDERAGYVEAWYVLPSTYYKFVCNTCFNFACNTWLEFAYRLT